MKKICLLLALVLLLSGCTVFPTQPEKQQTTVTEPIETSNTTQTQKPTQSMEGEYAYVPETTPEGKLVIPEFGIPEYDGELLIPVDPEREVYFLFHQKQDFYTGGQISNSIGYILTKHSYALEQIQLLADMQNDISVEVSDRTEANWIATGTSSNGMQLYHYITMQGGDWKQIAEANHMVNWIWDIHKKTNILPTSIATQLWELETKANSLSRGNSYRRSFEEYTLPEEPGFYIYEVIAKFSREYIEETVENVSIKVGQQEYPVDVIWRFHARPKYTGKPGATHMSIQNTGKFVYSTLGSPYSNGYIQVQEAVSLRTQKDMTITGMQCEMLEAIALGCHVVASGPSGDMDFYWDMQQPLEICEGTKVTIDLVLRSQDYEELWYNHTAQIKLDYEVNGGEYSFENQIWVASFEIPLWDAYLMAFLGVDLGEYYTSYYAVRNGTDWMDFLPESWLE